MKFSPYKKALALLFGYPKLLVGITLFTLLGTLTEGIGIGAVLPLLDSGFLEKMVSQNSNGMWKENSILQSFGQSIAEMTLAERVRFAAILLAFVVLLRTFFNVMTNLLASKMQLAIERDFEVKVFEQINALHIGFFNQQKMGELMNLVSYNVRRTGRMVNQVVSGIGYVFTLILYSLIALLVSWKLTLAVASLLLLVLFLSNNMFAERLKKTGKQRSKLRRKSKQLTLEALSAQLVIRLFSKEKWAMERYVSLSEDYMKTAQKSVFLTNISSFLVKFLVVLIVCGGLLASTFLFPEKLEDWLPSIILILAISFRLLVPIAQLNIVNSSVIDSSSKLDELLAFLKKEGKPYLKDGQIAFHKLEHGISLEQVSFRYDEKEAPVLRDVSFEIPKNSMVAIVGTSGGGKSSLVKLLARLFDVDSGSILVDGTDIRLLKLETWLSRMAVVTQSPFIFNDTVCANIRFGKENATKGEIVQAAKIAQAHEFILQLPQQYDTPLGDRGVRLSGGQQRRITIARAIIADPDLLIFDEATSDLDSETEHILQQAIQQFRGNRTMVVIAHRLSTVQEADLILVMENGRVVERGNHNELLLKNGLYKQLVKRQQLSPLNQ